MTSEDREYCYYCVYIDASKTSTMDLSAYCMKYDRKINLEDESCQEFEDNGIA